MVERHRSVSIVKVAESRRKRRAHQFDEVDAPDTIILIGIAQPYRWESAKVVFAIALRRLSAL